ncbi:hypothetical protein C2G38_2156085 [Gigaspora rosea]|uniref:Uncharacterized protein n=1 Tax=Gigaspora rosea TaxID=44941 RepID=A0A397W724_9GLOM|nr:hypothetical protein C2G38_2156085 [Gigaspora rosea]
MPSIQATCGFDKGDCLNGQTCGSSDDYCPPGSNDDCNDGQDCTDPSDCGILGKCTPVFKTRCAVALSNGCIVGGFKGNCKIDDL